MNEFSNADFPTVTNRHSETSHYRCVQTDTYAGIMAFDLKQEIATLKSRLRRVKTNDARERIEKTIEVMENSRKCIQSLNAKIQGWD